MGCLDCQCTMFALPPGLCFLRYKNRLPWTRLPEEWNSTKAENEEFWKAPRFALCHSLAKDRKGWRRDMKRADCFLEAIQPRPAEPFAATWFTRTQG